MLKLVLFLVLFVIPSVLYPQGKVQKIVFPISKSVSHKTISIPPKIYASLSTILIYENYLVSIEPDSDTIFSIFQLPGCKYIGSFGKIGRGPGEFFTFDARNAFVTQDGIKFKDTRNQFVEVNLRSYLKTGKPSLTIIKLPGEMDTMSDGFQLNDSIYCGRPYMGGRDNKPYIRCNIKTKVVETYGEWPNLYPKERQKTFWTLYGGRSRVKPDKTMYVSFLNVIKMFRIYDSAGNLKKEVVMELQDNLFDGDWIKSYPVLYYTCIRTTNKYIYALNIACRGPDSPKTIPSLEIWDWNGNPIANLKLDIPVSQFDITRDGKSVYCIDWVTMDKIFLYDLGDIIK